MIQVHRPQGHVPRLPRTRPTNSNMNPDFVPRTKLTFHKSTGKSYHIVTKVSTDGQQRQRQERHRRQNRTISQPHKDDKHFSVKNVANSKGEFQLCHTTVYYFIICISYSENTMTDTGRCQYSTAHSYSSQTVYTGVVL